MLSHFINTIYSSFILVHCNKKLWACSSLPPLTSVVSVDMHVCAGSEQLSSDVVFMWDIVFTSMKHHLATMTLTSDLDVWPMNPKIQSDHKVWLQVNVSSKFEETSCARMGRTDRWMGRLTDGRTSWKHNACDHNAQIFLLVWPWSL